MGGSKIDFEIYFKLTDLSLALSALSIQFDDDDELSTLFDELYIDDKCKIDNETNKFI